jgi:hypothetical protein
MAVDYIRGLVEETFRLKASDQAHLVEGILTSSSFKIIPPDAASLTEELQSRPDVQAQLASVTGYTPSRWVLERELYQVEARRAKISVAPPNTAESTAHPYKPAADLGVMGLCF